MNDHTDALQCLKRIGEKRLASGSWDETIRIWDFCDREKMMKLTNKIEHKSSISAFELLSDNLLVSIDSVDHLIKIWDLRSFECIDSLKGHTNCIEDLILIDDGLL